MILTLLYFLTSFSIWIQAIFVSSIDELQPLIDEVSVRRAIKSASFVLQAIVFLRTGKYVRLQKDLREMVQEDEKVIVDTFVSLKNGAEIQFDEMSEVLFLWAKKWI